MKFLFVAGTIVVPLIMYYLQQRQEKVKTLYHLIAFIALITFSNIIVIKVYEIITEGDVFTMEIHGLFLNPLFIISGAYLGIYVTFLLLLLCCRLNLNE